MLKYKIKIKLFVTDLCEQGTFMYSVPYRHCPLPLADTVHNTRTLLTHINLSQTILSVSYILTF